MKRHWEQLLDRGQHRYKGADFEVRIEPIWREVVSVSYSDADTSLNVEAVRTSSAWQQPRIHLVIPFGFDASVVSAMASRLKEAFVGIGYGIDISEALKPGPTTASDQQFRQLESSKSLID